MIRVGSPEKNPGRHRFQQNPGEGDKITDDRIEVLSHCGGVPRVKNPRVGSPPQGGNGGFYELPKFSTPKG